MWQFPFEHVAAATLDAAPGTRKEAWTTWLHVKEPVDTENMT